MRWIEFASLAMLVAACGGKSEGTGNTDEEGSRGGSMSIGAAAGSGESSGGLDGSSGTATDAKGGTSVGGDSAGPMPTTSEVIDDGDNSEGNPSLPPNSSGFWWGGAHLGNWFVSAPDPNGYRRDAGKVEIVPPREDSVWARAARDSGRDHGVDLFAQLDHPLGRPVDLGNYDGIAFWAMLKGANNSVVVGMNPGVDYFEHSNEVASVTIAVSSEWQRFELPFEKFGIDNHTIASFDFIVGEGGGDFELWIDDLTLLCRNECQMSN
ncbi:MAG TPA: hypothetical protein VFK05_35925 [Polyangiaceae bacterium]|nr:hypothetical protein [Polyangiaceae bacterium]